MCTSLRRVVVCLLSFSQDFGAAAIRRSNLLLPSTLHSPRKFLFSYLRFACYLRLCLSMLPCLAAMISDSALCFSCPCLACELCEFTIGVADLTTPPESFFCRRISLVLHLLVYTRVPILWYEQDFPLPLCQERFPLVVVRPFNQAVTSSAIPFCPRPYSIFPPSDVRPKLQTLPSEP